MNLRKTWKNLTSFWKKGSVKQSKDCKNEENKYLIEYIRRERQDDFHGEKFLNELSRIGSMYPIETEFLFSHIKNGNVSQYYLYNLFTDGEPVLLETNEQQTSDGIPLANYSLAD